MPASRPSTAVKLFIPVVALVISAGFAIAGALWTSSATGVLTTALTSQTGTAADVYGSQSAIVVSSALLSAGIVGVVVSLATFGILIGFGAFVKRDDLADDRFAEDAYGDEAEYADAVPAGAVPAAAAPAAAAAAPVATTDPVAGAPAHEDTATSEEQAVTGPAGTSASEALAEPAPAPEGDQRA